MRGYSHWGIIRRRLWVGNRVNRHPPDPTARDLYVKMLRLICLNATFRPYAWALIMLKCVDPAREIGIKTQKLFLNLEPAMGQKCI